MQIERERNAKEEDRMKEENRREGGRGNGEKIFCLQFVKSFEAEEEWDEIPFELDSSPRSPLLKFRSSPC